MKYLLVLLGVILTACSDAKTEEPTLEWTVRIMVRKIPPGPKKAFREARDYRKHPDRFEEQMSITIYTVGLKESIATASSKSGRMNLALIPTKDSKIRLSVAFLVAAVSPKGEYEGGIVNSCG
jgi:hypothetical protein